jgi:prefoldin subunit 5
MDEVAVLTETLNSTLQRHSRVAQAYEVEVANLTVEIIKLRNKVEELESTLTELAPLKDKEPKTTQAKP